MYRWNEPGATPTAAAWRETFIDLHGAGSVVVADAGPWQGRLEWQQSRSYGVVLCGRVREEFVREPRHIRKDARGVVELLVPTFGSAHGHRGGRQRHVRQA